MREQAVRTSRPRVVAVALAVVGALLFAGFLALGTWQVLRLSWKLDLIERVAQRVHAPATAAPGPAQWPRVSAATDEYRHVQVAGTLLHAQESLVQAVTELGSGYWVMTPLRTPEGDVVLVNRGFVPPEARERSAHQAGNAESPTMVTGLLRISEPGGGFLRHNDPAAGRWYSRDVPAIASAHGLHRVAPYFIDAEAAPATIRPTAATAWPAPGLTVIAFHNNHLVYAITWYTLALMVAGAAWYARRSGRPARPVSLSNDARAVDKKSEDAAPG